MSTNDLSLAFRLLRASPDELSGLLSQNALRVHEQSPVLPAIVWRVVQPASGEQRGVRAPLLRLLQNTTLPDFAIEALASLARSADGEELLPELIRILAHHATSSALARMVLLEFALDDGPEAASAATRLAASGADLTPHLASITHSLRRSAEAETVALLGATRSASGQLPDDVVTLLCDLLAERQVLDTLGQTAARLLLAGPAPASATLECCLAYFLRLAEAWEILPDELMLAYVLPAEYPGTTGEKLAELFRLQRRNRGVALALAVLAPAECTAILRNNNRDVSDGFAERLLEGIADGVAQLQRTPDWLSRWQVERLGVSLETAAEHAVSSGYELKLRALVRLLAGLGDTAALGRLFRLAASLGRPIVPSSFDEPYHHSLMLSWLPEGWTQTAFWQTHRAHMVRDEDVVMLAEWYPSLRTLRT